MSTEASAIGPGGDAPRPILNATTLGLVLSLGLIVFGWVAPLRLYLDPRSGLGYALGIIGGSLMLALLLYPLRKRIRLFKFIGSARVWFQIHMILGVAGPIAILYHCGYHLGATNSNVALWSMIIVAGSGLIGRYLYGRIHFGLYGSRASLDELHYEASRVKLEGTGAGRLLPGFGERLDRAEKLVSLDIPLVPKALTAVMMFRVADLQMKAFIATALRKASVTSRAVAEQKPKLMMAATRYSTARLMTARRVAEFQSCEKLFGLWHMLHLPLFGMLFIAGIVHVIAVNIY
jgi:hypothetical protein